MTDFAHAFARRTRLPGGNELATILAGSPPGVLSMTGGFPNAATFPTDELDEIAGRLVREDAAVALQYTPCEGIASVRDYLVERQEQLQGRRPERAELIVTSGGMECITLMCQALIDPGDTIAVEAPTYLAALMAFGRAEAETVAIAMDDDGLRVDELEERLAAGLRPKFVYTIPEYQNPTGRTLPLERRRELVELCRRHEVLILEDVAYRELSFDGTGLPDAVVARAGHRAADRDVLQELLPGRAARLGRRPGRRGRRARRRQAEHRPVRRRPRAAHGRGVRPRRGLRAPPPGGPGAVRVALGGSVGGPDAPHAGRCRVDRAHRAAFSPGSRCRRRSTRSPCARPPSRAAWPTSRDRRSTSATTAATSCGCRSAT